MAAIDTTRPVAVFSAGRVFRFAADLFDTVAAWNDSRKTRKALSALTSRELEDIGLSRADIARM